MLTIHSVLISSPSITARNEVGALLVKNLEALLLLPDPYGNPVAAKSADVEFGSVSLLLASVEKW